MLKSALVSLVLALTACVVDPEESTAPTEPTELVPTALKSQPHTSAQCYANCGAAWATCNSGCDDMSEDPRQQSCYDLCTNMNIACTGPCDALP